MSPRKSSPSAKPVKVWALEQDGEILFAEGMFWEKTDAEKKNAAACPNKTQCEDCARVRVIRVVITPVDIIPRKP